MGSSSGRLPPHFALDRYGVSPNDLLRGLIGCDASAIRQDVIMTPIWAVDAFLGHVARAEPIATDRVYDLHYKSTVVTLIRSGVGAPLTGDVVLSLADSRCNRIFFTGSVGGLLPTQAIGDLMAPTHSVSGDGFSTYLSAGFAPEQSFLREASPDANLQALLEGKATAAIAGTDVKIDKGAVFSIDSIVSQFQHLEWITGRLGCIGIEMETAATFHSSRLVGIKAAALLQFSDVIPRKKTLFSGRSEAEHSRKHEIRRTILARALLEACARAGELSAG